MNATILHDEHGRILSVSKIGHLAGSKFAEVRIIPGQSQQILEIKLNEEDEQRPLRELHREYRVDVATAKLVKKE
jgi:hypothetical protein